MAKNKIEKNETKTIVKVYLEENKLFYEVPLSVQELSFALGKNTVEIVKYFFNKGRLINPNIKLNEDEIIEICMHFDLNCEKILRKATQEESIIFEEGTKLVTRAPIVTIMGHVDHGKTTLLDYIRNTKVVDSEAGGITQKIGAYQVEYKNKKITFIDTPGHEAFTHMRAKGVKVTDIAIIVVSADDGVMPQTKEAIDHAKLAKLEIIVAINKIDREQADPEKVKQELADYDVMPEEWGGKTIFIELSAKTGKNVDLLLESIITLSEVMDLKSTNDGIAQGTIIESFLDKQKGPIVSVIIQKGKLELGNHIVAKTAHGKVKAMTNSFNKPIKEASLSQPAQILGFNINPDTGVIFSVCKTEKEAKAIAEFNFQENKKETAGLRQININEIEKDKVLNLIIKTDSRGSGEAINKCLSEIKAQDFKVNILRIQSGIITNSDVDLAIASKSMLIGFNIRPQSTTRDYAKSRGIEIQWYNIIYKLIDDIQNILYGFLPKEIKEIILGEAEVRQVFKVSKVGTIAGCYVLNGLIKNSAQARILRDGVTVITSSISSLKRFKEDAKTVTKDHDCGIEIKNFKDIKEKDIIEVFEIKETEAKRE